MSAVGSGTSVAAFFHHPDAVQVGSQPVIGRRVAGLGVLQGVIDHGRQELLAATAGNRAHLGHFRGLVSQLGWTGRVDTHPLSDLGGLGAASLMLPGPSLAPMAWARQHADPLSLSLCGLTHTMASPRVTSEILQSLLAPVREWDAIICTSSAVHRVVEGLFDEAEAYLGWRFEAGTVTRPQLPIVPLGIDARARSIAQVDRKRSRDELGVATDAVVILSVARRSVAEKQHPVPLFTACQRAAQITRPPVTLVMAGRFDTDESRSVHVRSAAALAPTVDVRFVDGEDSDELACAWSSADMFALAVDNVQETFGLAAVEAMAAGLPVIAPDWNGFAETVEHGVTGLLIPTRTVATPAPDLGRRLELGEIGHLDQLAALGARTIVDVDAMTSALVSLIESPSLRTQLGHAARRAAARYDWQVVIRELEGVWDDLEERRNHAADLPVGPTNPAFADPIGLYAHYATEALDTAVRIRRAPESTELDALLESVSGTYHPDAGLLQRVVAEIGAEASLDAFSESAREPADETVRAVAWLLKMGQLEMDGE